MINGNVWWNLDVSLWFSMEELLVSIALKAQTFINLVFLLRLNYNRLITFYRLISAPCN